MLVRGGPVIHSLIGIYADEVVLEGDIGGDSKSCSVITVVGVDGSSSPAPL